MAEKLKDAQEIVRRASIHCEESSDEEQLETEEEKVRRIEFEKRRKLHYDEASAIKLARKLMKDEDDDEGTTSTAAGGGDSIDEPEEKSDP